jgi:hypothetical protein
MLEYLDDLSYRLVTGHEPLTSTSEWLLDEVFANERLGQLVRATGYLELGRRLAYHSRWFEGVEMDVIWPRGDWSEYNLEYMLQDEIRRRRERLEEYWERYCRD